MNLLYQILTINTQFTVTASEHRNINLLNNTYGTLYHLNYPQPIPPNIDFSQHLIAPLGDVILLEMYNVGFSENGCQNGDSIEVSFANF